MTNNPKDTITQNNIASEPINDYNYLILVKCSNCMFVKEIIIDKGTEVANTECPKCGCKRLYRVGRHAENELEEIKSNL